MAGAGKSTIGEALAKRLDWAFMDSDHLIESVYAARLQDVTDALGKDAFLDVEATVISAIKANRTVMSRSAKIRPPNTFHFQATNLFGTRAMTSTKIIQEMRKKKSGPVLRE